MGMLLLLALLPLLAACVNGPPAGSAEACALVKVAELPVQFTRNLPMIEARVDGAKLRLMIDTGAEPNVLTEAAARRIGTQIDWNTPMLVTGSTGYQRMYTAKGKKLSAGDAVLDDQDFIVTPSSLTSSDAAPIDGVVGGAFLSKFDIDFDLPHARVVLYRGRACPAGSPNWTESFTTLVKPESWHPEQRRPLLDVTLDDHRFTALLDTGTEYTLVTAATTTAMKLTPNMLAADPTFTLTGATEEAEAVPIHRFKRLVIGNETIGNPRFGVIRQSSGAMGGLIAADFMRQHRVWVSYASQQIFLSTRVTPAKP